MNEHETSVALAKNTLDSIPTTMPNAQRIVGLVREHGKVVGYQLSDGAVLQKTDAVKLAKQGGILGVGIAHRGSTEYLKAIPDGREQNNLGCLPSVTPQNYVNN